ncbi:MAG: phosphoribosylamine--glycine ligase [Eubacteriales bacterium]
MTVLVVGGGGREHAIVRSLSLSPRVKKLYAAPGNAGIAKLAALLPIKATDIDSMVAAAKDIGADLVFVAPDDPLTLGMVDAMNDAGIRAFGPTARAARIEGSKVFSKGMMKKYGIPTADYETFSNPEDAMRYIERRGEYPTVIKADGLALGKGAVIAEDHAAAADAIHSIMCDKVFGASGNNVVVEQFLRGPELTVLSFVDGEHVVPMVSSQDHKRALDGDLGLNTGGMGAFSPSRHYTPELEAECMEKIFLPTVRAMNAEDSTFKGVIYFQLMLTDDGPKVIEYNARFGDPETQAVLPRLKTDLCDIIDACIDGTLDKINIEWHSDAACCVVMASGGYPVKYQTGYPISGLDALEGRSDVYVYHAGTKSGENGEILTSGGRVLGVTALGATLDEAIAGSYEAVRKINFKDAHYRTDIGRK